MGDGGREGLHEMDLGARVREREGDRSGASVEIEQSRALAASDDQFDLAPDHCAEKPNIRRLRKAVDQHPELWAFAQDPSVVDLVADLLGPDVRFHSSKLNFKWSSGGDAVRWHQDIQAWPHTSFSVLTFRRLHRGHGIRAGPAHRDSRLAPRADLRPVRRRGPVDRRGDAA